MAATKSNMDFANNVSCRPVRPLCKEPTMVIAPTQNRRDALTNPSAIPFFSPPPEPWNFFSRKFPRRLIFSSRSSASPIRVPITMERISTKVFSPSREPLIPMYMVHRPNACIIRSEKRSDTFIPNFFVTAVSNKPKMLPASTAKVFTIVPSISDRNLHFHAEQFFSLCQRRMYNVFQKLCHLKRRSSHIFCRVHGALQFL